MTGRSGAGSVRGMTTPSASAGTYRTSVSSLARQLGLILLVLAVCLAAGAGGAYWVLARYSVHVPLHEQALQVSMPDDLPVSVEVVGAGDIGAAVADERGVPVRLDEYLDVNVMVDTEVPVNTEVHYRGSLPVKARIPVDTQMKTQLMGMDVMVPVQGTIPVDLALPVDLRIPINQAVKFKFTAPVRARVNQTVYIPVRAKLAARIRFDDPSLQIMVRQAQLALPLDQIWLTGPSPFGRGERALGPLSADTAPVPTPP